MKRLRLFRQSLPVLLLLISVALTVQPATANVAIPQVPDTVATISEPRPQQQAVNFYVDAVNGSDVTGNGAINTPWQTISYALSQISVSSAQVNIRAGQYNEALGESFPILMKPGISLVGAGFTTSIVSGNGTEPVFRFPSGLTFTQDTTIQWLQITNGAQGVRVEGSTGSGDNPVIQNNWLTGNTSGIYLETASSRKIYAQIRNNIITNNTYGIHGKADRIQSTVNPFIENNQINNNTIGIYCWASSAGDDDSFCAGTVHRNIIRNNSSHGMQCTTYYAGNCSQQITSNKIYSNGGWGYVRSHSGTYLVTSRPYVASSLFYDNSSGGISFYNYDQPQVVNSTVVDNTTYGVQSANATIINSIIWGHSDDLNTGLDKVSYSNVSEVAYEDRDHTTSVDPQFVNALQSNYHLASTSPLIGRGNGSYSNLPPYDVDGTARIVGANIDIGADEETPYSLAISQQVAPTSVAAGELVTYTVTITNQSATPAVDAAMRDTLPTDVRWGLNAQTSTGHIVGTQNEINWTGEVSGLSTVQLSYNARLAANLTPNISIMNTASLLLQNGQMGDSNTTVVTTRSGPVWALSTQSVDLQYAKSGDRLSYTIQLQNSGDAAAQNATVTTPLHPKTTFFSASNGGTLNNQKITWSIPTLGAGASTTLTFAVDVNASTSNGTLITHPPTVTDDSGYSYTIDPASTLVHDAGGAIAVYTLFDTISNDGQCTLREAIIAANTNTSSGNSAGECPAGGASDLIDLTPINGTIQLTGPLPDITSDVIILGPGATNLTIDARNYGRIIKITSGDVTISGVTLTNGFVDATDGRGGAVYNQSSGTVRIVDSVISNSDVVGANGQSSSQGGQTGCCYGGGGGFFHNGPGSLEVTNTTFSNNSAIGGNGGNGSNGHGGGGGGGAFGAGLFSNGGPVIVSNATFVDNTVQGGNGGAAPGGSSGITYGGGGGGAVDGLGAGGRGGGNDGNGGHDGNFGGGGGGAKYPGPVGQGGIGGGNGGPGNGGDGGGGGGIGAAIFINGGQADVQDSTFTNNLAFGGLGGNNGNPGENGQGLAKAIYSRSVTTLSNNNIPNQPPQLSNMVPIDTSVGVLPTPTFSWQAVDPDADVHLGGFGGLKVTLKLGTTPNTMIDIPVTGSTYTPAQPLNYETTYYWQLTVQDPVDIVSSSVMSFTTAPKITLVVPNELSDGATNVSLSQQLTWLGIDAVGDALTYDVEFGLAPDALVTLNNVTSPLTPPVELNYATTYTWRVTANDGNLSKSTGLLQFTTRADGKPGFTSFSPANGATDVARDMQFDWTAVDGDNDLLSYIMWLGTDVNNLTQIQGGGVVPPLASPISLQYNTRYYWQMQVSDGSNSSVSDIMSFTTVANTPAVMGDFSPTDGATNVSVDQLLSWTGVDNEGHWVIYDLLIGTDPNNLTTYFNAHSPFDPGILSYGKTYYWQIKSSDQYGAKSSSNLFTFTTEPLVAASCGFSDSFENGSLGAEWRTNVTNNGRVMVATGYPRTGSYSLLLDDDTPGGQYSLAQAFLAVDLSDSPAPHRLSFWWREFDDENHVEDGVFISNDELTWSRVISFEDGPTSYTKSVINLNAEAAARNYNFDEPVYIKFQGYDDYPISSDGFTIDDVSIDCQSNQAPVVSGLTPVDQTTDIPTSNSTLSWTASDPDGDPLNYTVEYGTDPNALVNVSNLTSMSFDLPPLLGSAIYYWQVTASDGATSTTSSLISFTTTAPACAPINAASLVRHPGGTVFEDTPVQFTATAEGTKPFTHKWRINGALVENASSVYSTVFNQSGQYDVEVEISNACTTTPVTQSMLIEVNQKPDSHPDLTASSLVSSLSRVREDDVVIYTIVLRNQSSNVANNVTMTAGIPSPYTTYVTGSASASDDSTVNVSNGQIIWSGNVRLGTPIVVSYAVKISAAPVGEEITSRVTINDGADQTVNLETTSIYDPIFRLSINEGAIYTNVPTVTLSLSWGATANPIESVLLSNDGGFGDGTQSQLASESAEWVISTYGNLVLPRTVYATFLDGVGNDYGPFQDDIIYDPTVPEVEVQLISASTKTEDDQRSNGVIIRVTSSDSNSGVERVLISDSPAFESDATETHTITTATADFPWNRPGSVYVKVIDRAGNSSSVEQLIQNVGSNQLFLPIVVK